MAKNIARTIEGWPPISRDGPNMLGTKWNVRDGPGTAKRYSKMAEQGEAEEAEEEEETHFAPEAIYAEPVAVVRRGNLYRRLQDGLERIVSEAARHALSGRPIQDVALDQEPEQSSNAAPG